MLAQAAVVEGLDKVGQTRGMLPREIDAFREIFGVAVQCPIVEVDGSAFLLK